MSAVRTPALLHDWPRTIAYAAPPARRTTAPAQAVRWVCSDCGLRIARAAGFECPVAFAAMSEVGGCSGCGLQRQILSPAPVWEGRRG